MTPVPGAAGFNSTLAAPNLADHFVGNSAVYQRHRDHVLSGSFASFADGLGNLGRLPQTDANLAVFIAGGHQRCKAETPTALDYFSHAIDVNYLFLEFKLLFSKLRQIHLSYRKF